MKPYCKVLHFRIKSHLETRMWKLGCFSQEKHLRLHLLSIKCYCCLGETIEVLQKRHQWPHKLQRNEHNATEYLYRSTKNKVVSYLGDAHWPLITSYRRTPMKPVCTMMMMMSLPGTFDSSITNKPHTTLIIGASNWEDGADGSAACWTGLLGYKTPQNPGDTHRVSRGNKCWWIITLWI